MNKLSREDVLKLARLSRLQLTDDEIKKFEAEIGALLEYVEVLQKVDVDGLEPTYQVTGLKDVMRPDEVADYGPDAQALLKNAPATEAGHFKVKRMVK
jgi:aspartyl-tRNA(Asn)/glutamyl-tRNA(Gln) amidotransferase subunit C